MKKVRFDKLITLTVESTDEEVIVVVNGVKLRLEDNILKEKVVVDAPFLEQKAITDKYDLENWKIKLEDTEAYMKESKELMDKYTTYNEVTITVWDINVIDRINELQSK